MHMTVSYRNHFILIIIHRYKYILLDDWPCLVYCVPIKRRPPIFAHFFPASSVCLISAINAHIFISGQTAYNIYLRASVPALSFDLCICRLRPENTNKKLIISLGTNWNAYAIYTGQLSCRSRVFIGRRLAIALCIPWRYEANNRFQMSVPSFFSLFHPIFFCVSLPLITSLASGTVLNILKV